MENELSSHQLIDLIKQEVYSGHGFVPLIGSGMSAPSGILMGMEFSNYLAYAVYLAVEGVDGVKWNFKKDGWPRTPRDEEVMRVKKWAFESFKEICKKRGYSLEKGGKYEVKTVRFGVTGDSPSTFVQAINRPLIPEVIRSKSPETWQSETRTREIQRQFLGQGNWQAFDEGEGFSRTSQEFTKELAIRSLHDWRATLQFLSQTELNSTLKRVFVSPTPDPSIIDSFNVHITRDRQINLGQKMLAHLVRPMRIRTILTTNFDNLIEKSFEKLLIPIEVVSVTKKAGLPNPETVRAQNTLVKLHGELIETRADFTLDEEPSFEDKENFAKYVRGEFDDTDQTVPIPNHMMVIGFSGSDMRIIQMIKYLLDSRPTVKVFWICFSKWDLQKIEATFGDEYKNRITYYQTHRPDLFLYELYQETTLCLPGGGFSYEFSHKVPPQPFQRFHFDQEELTRQLESDGGIKIPTGVGLDELVIVKREIRQAISDNVGRLVAEYITGNNKKEIEFGQPIPYPEKQPMAYLQWDKVNPSKLKSEGQPREIGLKGKLAIATGASNSMRESFRVLSEQGVHCLWLELQDYKTATSLAQDVLRIIALRLGIYQLEHVVLYADKRTTPDKETHDEKFMKEFESHLNRLLLFFGMSKKKWVIFLYGRDVPGSCSGWRNAPWTKVDIENLEKLLTIFAQNGVHSLTVPYTKERCKTEATKIDGIRERTTAQELDSLNLRPDKKFETKQASLGLTQKERLAIVKQWKKATQKLKDETKKAREKAKKATWKKPIVVNGVEVNFRDNPLDLGIFGMLKHSTLNYWLSNPTPVSKSKKKSKKKPNTLKGLGIPEQCSSNLKTMRLPGEKKDSDPQAIVNRRYLNGIKFLYSTTLFRQSRHTSAFFSDAVFSCPFRFNGKGLDNDFERSKQVRDWITNLGSLDVFFYKPGGYSWKHRDIRLALQRTLETIPWFRYWGKIDEFKKSRGAGNSHSKNAAGGMQSSAYLRQMKSRIHFWIGEWYFKAFAATGHHMPLVESLYHRFSCLRNVFEAKPGKMPYHDPKPKLIDERFEYQIVLCRSALMEMIKTLRIARPWLKFWLSNVEGYPMFEPRSEEAFEEWWNDFESWFDKTKDDRAKFVRKNHIKPNTQRSLDNDLRLLEDRKSDLRRLKDLMQNEIKAIQNSLKGEAGNFVGKMWIAPAIPDRSKDDTLNQEILEPISLNAEKVVAKSDNENERFDQLFREKFKNYKAKFIPKLMKSYEGIDNHSKFNEEFQKQKASWIQRGLVGPTQDSDDGSSNIVPHVNYDIRLLRLVNLISEYAYLHIKRAKIEYKKDGVWTESSWKRWGQCSVLCNLGIDFCRHLHPHFFQEELRLKIKLQTMYGLALGHLERTFESNRHFNEANALISKASRSMDEVEVAIIRLRRAEVHLLQTERISEVQECIAKIVSKRRKKKKNPYGPKNAKRFFDDLERTLNKKYDKGKNKNKTVKFCVRKSDEPRTVALNPRIRMVFEDQDYKTDDYVQKILQRLNRQHSASLDDAWVTLESAEKLLAGYSQSSLWWGKLAELKLAAYGQLRKNAEYESLVFARKVQHNDEIERLFQRILLISPTSTYAFFRAADTALEAMIALSEQKAKSSIQFTVENKEQIKAALKEGTKFAKVKGKKKSCKKKKKKEKKKYSISYLTFFKPYRKRIEKKLAQYDHIFAEQELN